MRESKQLPESELDIMLAIWAENGPATAPRIADRLERPLTASALHSYLKRLEEKGFLTCDKEKKVNLYTPLVTQETYREQEGKTILDKLYGKSIKRFAAALYDGGNLDKADVTELRAFLDALEEES